MDFNHLTLVQRGVSSTSPYPAGSYKKEGEENKKDVNFSFAEKLPDITITPQIDLDASSRIIAGIPTKVTANLKNTGSGSIIGGKMKLESKFLAVEPGNEVDFNIIPPFSNREVPYVLQSKSFLTKLEDPLVLSFNEVQVTKPIAILPFYFLFVSPGFLASAVLVVVFISGGLLLYYKMHKKKLVTKTNMK
jgi:hypothetical protein